MSLGITTKNKKKVFNNWFTWSVVVLLVAVILVFAQLLRPVSAYSSTDFVFTIKTDNGGVSADNEFRIPTFWWVHDTYNYNVDCDADGIIDHVNADRDVVCSYASPGEYTVAISGQFPAIYFNDGGDKLKIIDIEQWGSNAWVTLERAFKGATNLTATATDAPNLTSSNISMRQAFYGASSFNPDTLNWDVSNVTNMAETFTGATSFNGNVTNWDTGSVTMMYNLFSGAQSFNGDVSDWDTSSVTVMSSMFRGATIFNSDLSDWDTSNVEYMERMFDGARSFEGDVSTWNVEKVRRMDYMFYDANAFNGDLSAWRPLALEQADSMFHGTSMSRVYYDQLLAAWSELEGLPSNINFGAEGLFYSDTAARQKLIDEHGWQFTGDLYSNYQFFDPSITDEQSDADTGSASDQNSGDNTVDSAVDVGQSPDGVTSFEKQTPGSDQPEPASGITTGDLDDPVDVGGADDSAGGSNDQGDAANFSGETDSGGHQAGNTDGSQAAPDRQKPALIKQGWDNPRASWLASHVEQAEQLPFDGVAVRLDSSSLEQEVFSSQPVSYQDLQDSVAALRGVQFTSLKHNMLKLNIGPVGDLDDDAAWSVAADNLAKFAKAAHWAGLTGIMFDDESYTGAVLSYGDDCSAPTYTVPECQQLAHQRGKQIMDALRSEWPDVVVLTLHGPTISSPGTQNFYQLNGVGYSVQSRFHQLIGPFSVGMVESAAGSDATFVNGGEVYDARTKQDFSVIKYWVEQGFPINSNYVAPQLKSIWSDEVSSSFGIYAHSISPTVMNPDVWRTTLVNAMTYADDYVWVHTEGQEWWGEGTDSRPKVSSQWVDATRQAIEDFK